MEKKKITKMTSFIRATKTKFWSDVQLMTSVSIEGKISLKFKRFNLQNLVPKKSPKINQMQEPDSVKK